MNKTDLIRSQSSTRHGQAELHNKQTKCTHRDINMLAMTLQSMTTQKHQSPLAR